MKLIKRLLWPVVQVKHAFKLTPVHVAHHIIGALMIASLMLALEGLHVLEWLDAAMLRVGGEQSQMRRKHDDPGAAFRPSIVEIDRQSFQTVFQEREPLDRARLAQLLERLGDSKVLAIDLDLAPAIYEAPHDGPRALDTVLDHLAANSKLVLILPEPSDSNANLAWIRARCAAGIHFASPLISERMGSVTRVDLKSPVLAAVAFELAHGADAQEQAQPMPAALSQQKPAASLADRVCDLATARTTEKTLYDAAFAPATARDGTDEVAENDVTAPLHPLAVAPPFFQALRTGVVLLNNEAGVAPNKPLRPGVFLGSTYDALDELTTAEGPQPGLYLHAASFTSLGIGTADLNKYAVFAADVVIGIALGWLFGGLWTLYATAEVAVGGKLHDNQTGHRPGTVAAYYGIRLLLVGVWMVPVLLGAFALYLSHGLLVRGWWVNPGPLIAGTFLHAMALRDEVVTHHEAVPGESLLSQLWRLHPGTVLLQAPLAALFFVVAIV